MNHTLAPWIVNGSCVYSPDGEIIAQVFNPGSKETDYPLIPNRNLIAAAPELLAACRGLLGVAERFRGLLKSHPIGNQITEADAAIIAARNAIAKADGRA